MMHSSKESGRKLRAREKRRYTEEMADEDIEGKQNFCVEDKLFSDEFDHQFVKDMKGEEVNLKYFQENGFSSPIVVKSKSGLGIKVPDKSFTVNDVKQAVGSRRMLDVMDVNTQKDIEMSMKEWCQYFEKPERERLLNVISLEFSHTKLEEKVEAPTIVRQVDWVDWVWPKHLKHLQTESTNVIEDMKYPKVQKYCLMSVKGCYTDFHIDFGGTSVWYHILKGHKVFWLIPPSEKNIQLYEQWVLSGKQTDIFFGETVEQCGRISLSAGHTFFIPTGWIHAVYTLEDSLVFGGNFLHSFGIEKQLRIAQVEDITRVPSKFRYPFYSEMLWYVLQRYVYCLSDKNHLSCNEEGVPNSTDVQSSSYGNSSALSSYGNHVKVKVPTENVHITQFELNGLKAIIMWLSRLPNGKRAVPELIVNPDALLNDAKVLVDEHSNDDCKLAVSGKSVLFWTSKKSPQIKENSHSHSVSHTPSSGPPMSVTAQLRQMKYSSFSAAFKSSSTKLNSSSVGTPNVDAPVKRPESPPTRPISSNQYAVGLSSSCKTLDQIPSSFADLIAATDVNQSRANASPIPMPPVSCVSSNTSTAFTTMSSTGTNPSTTMSTSSTNTISTTTQTNPLPLPGSSIRVLGSPEIVSSIISKDFAPNSNISKMNTGSNTMSTPLFSSNFGITSTVTTGTVLTGIAALGNVTNMAVNNNNNKQNASANDSSRRRRTRCKKCESCLRADCGECHFCKDMKKFGGPGRMKQSCIARQCMAPVLPHTACCMICGRDGWEKLAAPNLDDATQSSLMECSKCWEIAHPVCLKEKSSAAMPEGVISDELPNSWECPKCIMAEKQALLNKPKTPTKVANSTITINGKHSSPVASDAPIKKIKLDDQVSNNSIDDIYDLSDTGDESSDHNSNASFSEKPTSGVPSVTSSVTSSVASPTFNSHVRSCARFPLLQEAIKQQQEQQQQQKTCTISSQKSMSSASSTSSSSSSTSSTSTSKVPTESKIVTKAKRSSETSRDRLFRSLKGLKKTSEMKRFSSGASSFSNQFSLIKKVQSKLTPTALNPKNHDSHSGLMSSASSTCSNGSTNGTSKASSVLLEEHPSPMDVAGHNQEKNQDTKCDVKVFDEETDNEESDREKEVKSPSKSTSRPSSPSVSEEEDEEESLMKKVSEKKDNGDSVRCSSNRPLRKPMYVVRPAPLPEDVSESDDDTVEEEEDDETEDESNKERNRILRKHLKKLRKKKVENLGLERDVILPVLPHLSRKDLINCMSVCKAWNCWCLDPKLWSKLDLTRHKLTSTSLIGLVKRQPLHLNLSWTNVSKRQLSWLLPRLPQLQTLTLAGCSSLLLPCFSTCNCPLLKSLDLSWIDGVGDPTIRDLLAAPTDSRPGVLETKTRLRNLNEIKLAGSDVSDVSLRLMSHHLPQISKLDLSCCQKVTDMGIAVLGAAKSSRITSLKLSSSPNISDTTLESLKRCPNLKYLDVRDCSQVTLTACERFLHTFGTKNHLIMKVPKLFEFKGS